jgi:hypothetical protein
MTLELFVLNIFCICICRQLTARGVVRAMQFVEEQAETQRLLAIVIKIADDPG